MSILDLLPPLAKKKKRRRKRGGGGFSYEELLAKYEKLHPPSLLTRFGRGVKEVGKSAVREVGEALGGLVTLAGLPVRWGYKAAIGKGEEAVREAGQLLTEVPKAIGEYYAGYVKDPIGQIKKYPVNVTLDALSAASLVGGGLKAVGKGLAGAVGKATLSASPRSIAKSISEKLAKDLPGLADPIKTKTLKRFKGLMRHLGEIEGTIPAEMTGKQALKRMETALEKAPAGAKTIRKTRKALKELGVEEIAPKPPAARMGEKLIRAGETIGKSPWARVKGAMESQTPAKKVPWTAPVKKAIRFIDEIKVGGTTVGAMRKAKQAGGKIEKELFRLQRRLDDIKDRVGKEIPEEALRDLMLNQPAGKPLQSAFFKQALTEGQTAAVHDLVKWSRDASRIFAKLFSREEEVVRRMQPLAIEAGEVTPYGPRTLERILKKKAAIEPLTTEVKTRAKIQKRILKEEAKAEALRGRGEKAAARRTAGPIYAKRKEPVPGVPAAAQEVRDVLGAQKEVTGKIQRRMEYLKRLKQLEGESTAKIEELQKKLGGPMLSTPEGRQKLLADLEKESIFKLKVTPDRGDKALKKMGLAAEVPASRTVRIVGMEGKRLVWEDVKTGERQMGSPSAFEKMVKTHLTPEEAEKIRVQYQGPKFKGKERTPAGEVIEKEYQFQQPLYFHLETKRIKGKPLQRSSGELYRAARERPELLEADPRQFLQTHFQSLRFVKGRQEAYEAMKKFALRPATSEEIAKGVPVKPLNDTHQVVSSGELRRAQTAIEKIFITADKEARQVLKSKEITDPAIKARAAEIAGPEGDKIRETIVRLNSLVASGKEAHVVPKQIVNLFRDLYDGPRPKGDNLMGAAWDVVNNAWRHTTLALMPRFQVINAAGNFIMALLSGAAPQDAARAARWGKEGKLAKFLPEEVKIPSGVSAAEQRVYSRGGATLKEKLLEAAEKPAEPTLGGSAMKAAGVGIKAWKATGEKAIQLGYKMNQDVDRLLKTPAYLAVVRKKAEKALNVPLVKRFSKSYTDLLEAKMEDILRSPKRAQKALDKLNEFYYHLDLLGPNERRYVRRFISPFYSWYKHAATMVARLHLQYPLRGEIAQKLSLIGEKLNKKTWEAEGVPEEAIPEFAKGALPMGKTKEGNLVYWRGQYWNPLFLGSIVPSLGPVPAVVMERLFGGRLFPPGKKFSAADVVQIGNRHWRWDEKRRVAVPARIQDALPSIFEHLAGQIPQYQLAKVFKDPRLQYDTASIFNPLIRTFATGKTPSRDRVRAVFLKAFGVNLGDMEIEEYIGRWQKEQKAATSALLRRGIREGYQR